MLELSTFRPNGNELILKCNAKLHFALHTLPRKFASSQKFVLRESFRKQIKFCRAEYRKKFAKKCARCRTSGARMRKKSSRDFVSIPQKQDSTKVVSQRKLSRENSWSRWTPSCAHKICAPRLRKALARGAKLLARIHDLADFQVPRRRSVRREKIRRAAQNISQKFMISRNSKLRAEDLCAAIKSMMQLEWKLLGCFFLSNLSAFKLKFFTKCV